MLTATHFHMSNVIDAARSGDKSGSLTVTYSKMVLSSKSPPLLSSMAYRSPHGARWWCRVSNSLVFTWDEVASSDVGVSSTDMHHHAKHPTVVRHPAGTERCTDDRAWIRVSVIEEARVVWYSMWSGTSHWRNAVHFTEKTIIMASNPTQSRLLSIVRVSKHRNGKELGTIHHPQHHPDQQMPCLLILNAGRGRKTLSNRAHQIHGIISKLYPPSKEKTSRVAEKTNERKYRD